MERLKRFGKGLLDGIFMLRDEPESEQGPSWKFRRKLIFGSYRLAFAMIIFGAFTFLIDQWGVGVALIGGGVTLISIITTAYTASATWQDTKMHRETTYEEIDV